MESPWRANGETPSKMGMGIDGEWSRDPQGKVGLCRGHTQGGPGDVGEGDLASFHVHLLVNCFQRGAQVSLPVSHHFEHDLLLLPHRGEAYFSPFESRAASGLALTDASKIVQVMPRGLSRCCSLAVILWKPATMNVKSQISRERGALCPPKERSVVQTPSCRQLQPHHH